MIEATLRLMCGDRVVDRWVDRTAQLVSEDSQRDVIMSMIPPGAPSLVGDSLGDMPEEETEEEKERRLTEEAERRAREEEEEKEGRRAAARLAVLFVVSSKQDSETPQLAPRVRFLCDLAGAHCAILPSPDTLVATLAHFANREAGHTVTNPPVFSLLRSRQCSTTEVAPEDIAVSLTTSSGATVSLTALATPLADTQRGATTEVLP